MRRQPPGPLPKRRLRDELPDPRLPELRFTPCTPPTFCAPELRAPAAAPARHLRAGPDARPETRTHLPSQALQSGVGARAAVLRKRTALRPGASVKTLLELPFITPLPHARQLQAGAPSRRQTPGRSRAPLVLHHHNSNSTLPIKVSKLAQAPPPTHGPELQGAQGQRWRALGTAWQADADPGGPSRSPTNSDNPRVPGPPSGAGSP